MISPGGQALVYTAAECAVDPQFCHRGMVGKWMIRDLVASFTRASCPMCPKTPVKYAGPDQPLDGLRPEEIAALRAEGVL